MVEGVITMNIIYYTNIQEFVTDFKDILLVKEEINQLILFNATNMLTMEQKEQEFFGCIRNDTGELKMIFLHLPPYNLLTSTFGQIEPLEIVEFAKEIARKHPNIRGINGTKEITDLFCSAFSEVTGVPFYQHFALSVMKLSQVNDCLLPAGNFRVANISDLPLVIEWNKEFFDEIGESVEVLDEYIQRLTTRINEGKYHLYEDEHKKIVSMAAASRYLTYGVAIGPVYTAKYARNKGYGMAVVHHLSKKILEEGYRYATLFVDQMNPISNRVYLKIGYEIVEDQFDMRQVQSSEAN
jgi:predicted GNAT family acetyltransferase